MPAGSARRRRRQSRRSGHICDALGARTTTGRGAGGDARRPQAPHRNIGLLASSVAGERDAAACAAARFLATRGLTSESVIVAETPRMDHLPHRPARPRRVPTRFAGGRAGGARPSNGACERTPAGSPIGSGVSSALCGDFRVCRISNPRFCSGWSTSCAAPAALPDGRRSVHRAIRKPRQYLIISSRRGAPTKARGHSNPGPKAMANP